MGLNDCVCLELYIDRKFRVFHIPPYISFGGLRDPFRPGSLARFVRRVRFEPFHSSGRVFSHLTAGDSSEPGKYNIILSRGRWWTGGGAVQRC